MIVRITLILRDDILNLRRCVAWRRAAIADVHNIGRCAGVCVDVNQRSAPDVAVYREDTLFIAAARAAFASIVSHWPAAIARRGATQEPPTQATLASAR